MALSTHLESLLKEVARRQARLRLLLRLASCWAGAAFAGLLLVLVERQTGWPLGWAIPVLALAAIAACFVATGSLRREPDLRQVARDIEARHPELNGLLITAAQQNFGGDKRLNYLQSRLVRDALFHGAVSNWLCAVPRSRLVMAQAANVLAVAFLTLVLWELRPTPTRTATLKTRTRESLAVEVTPGNAHVEKGSSLVVLARFAGPLPASVELVIGDTGGQTRLPLVKSLADPVFGMSLTEVTTNFTYHVLYGNHRTADFKVTVFEHPRLERADASLLFPEYTQMEPRTVRDTRRVSAVEGSQLSYILQLNKPVTSARLVPKSKGGVALLLHAETNRPVAHLEGLPLLATETYDLHLKDPEGRSNKVAAQFVFQVLKNRTPELRLAFPRGDIRPSALEEIHFEGTVSDDFGLQAYGVGYALAGEEPKYLQLGTNTAANQKRSFDHLLRLEDLDVAPDHLLCWFLWADDFGPDGEPRRTTGDLFFGEVRPFEAVYREGQGNDGGSSEQAQEGSGGGQLSKLTELQKQIISATWKLKGRMAGARTPLRGEPPRQPAAPGGQSSHRISFPATVPLVMAQTRSQGRSRQGSLPPAPGNAGRPADIPEDADVVLQSQAQALEQAQSAFQNQQDPRAAGLWQSALEHMQKAVEKLEAAKSSPELFTDALAAEQSAYQALLRLQEHQYQVNRRRQNQGQSGGGQREQQMQRQLEQMELTQSENRYETRRQAQAPQSAQRTEESQLLNRLQQLAQRQEHLNERLKELQTALQEAKTEEEREEIRRRLKRLEEEERRMLADLDEMRERMDRAENQSRMAEQRQQLDRTREDVERAAEAAGKGEASQALASGSRAQEQLQQMREQMRQSTANRFAEDLREMRTEARDLSRKQQELNTQIDAEPRREGKSLQETAGPGQMVADLEQQKQRLTNLVERASQVSRDAETAEPLLSRQLYDALRKLSQNSANDLKDLQNQLLNRGLLTPRMFEQLSDPAEQDASKLLQVTAEMVRRGVMTQAGESGKRALSAMNDLQRGIEAAAESLLGDDTEALRQAQAQLTDLTQQLEREAAAAAGATNAPVAGTPAAQEDPPAGNTNGLLAGLESPPGERSQQRRTGGTAAERSEEDNQPNRGGRPEGAGRAQPNETAASGQAQNPSDSPQGSRNAGERRGGERPGDRQGWTASGGVEGGGDAGGNLRDFLDQLFDGSGFTQAGPITGNDFIRWSEQVRNVEDILDFPELRNEVASARERVRQMRQDFKRDLKKPDWAVVRLQVINPLVEVRDRIAEELTRRGSREALVPVDRDPVPGRYSDLVRTYYERLGKDQ